MRALRVDFARPRAWPVGLLWVLAIAMAGVVAWRGVEQHASWQALREQRERTDGLQRQLDRQRAQLAAQAASAALPTAFTVDALRLRAMSSADVAGVLRSIESVQVPGAKVSRLDIDTATRKVEVELDVSSADIATDYLQALNAGADLPPWSLARVQSQGGVQSALIRGKLF